MNELLRLEHIQKIYGNGGVVTRAIDDISFSVSSGEFLGIMGASGSGKTTLLNCISTIDTVSAVIGDNGTGKTTLLNLIGGIEHPTSGSVEVGGVDVCSSDDETLSGIRRRKLGYIFQDFNLLDTLTVGENIALALTINKVPPGQIDGQVQQMADALNIGDILSKFPYADLRRPEAAVRLRPGHDKPPQAHLGR